MEFTRILELENSLANTFTAELIAALDDAYKSVPETPNKEEIEEMKIKEEPLLSNFFFNIYFNNNNCEK